MDFKDILPFVLTILGIGASYLNNRTKSQSVDIETRMLLNAVVIDLRNENRRLNEEVAILKEERVADRGLIAQLRLELDTLKRQVASNNPFTTDTFSSDITLTGE